MSKIALLPGGFKPPHAGHYNMVKWLSANTGADKTIVFVGPKEREGITQEMSVLLWKLYTQNDSELEVRPAGVSPVRDVYDFIEQEASEGSTVFLGMGEKDISDKRFANIPKFAEPKNITFKTKLVPPQAKGISGTQMRNFIKDNNKTSFHNSLPDHLSNEQKEQAWKIVNYLDEDFYDPKNKYYDFAKSSVPGPKKDIPRKKDQIRNRQTAPVSWEESLKGGKILHAYDFDDTIARVKANIRTTITNPKGDYKKELLIPAENFPEESKELEARLGNLEIKYDFSEFEKQINDAIVNSKVVSKLQKSLSNPQVKTTILTARSIGHPVTKYLKSIGLDAYVVPLGLQVKGKVRGIDKANWIEKHINKGYNTIYFIDDSEDNRTAVSSLKDKYPDIELKVEDPAAVSEMMMGMMTEPEKKKHAKNMKRLKKDMSKMKGNNYGGGGYKVPNYVKGTLTRKLHELDIPQPGETSDVGKEFKPESKPIIKHLTVDKLLKQVKDIPYYKDVVGDLKKGDESWAVTKKVKEYADYMMKNPSSLKTLPPLSVIDGKLNDGAHRISAIYLLKELLDSKNYFWKNLKLETHFYKKEDIKTERKLSDKEEKIAKDLPDKEFKDRYGKEWKSVKIATATKMAKKENILTKEWWKEIIKEILLKEGGAAGHMAHPFDLSSVKTGKDLKNIIEKAARSLEKNPGAVKIDGINSSIRLVDLDGKKQFVMDRGSKMALDVKGITKSDLGNRFKPGHGMIKVGGEVLDMFNEALPSLKKDLIKLGAWEDPNLLFNMEYVEGKTNVQKYDNNFVAIHGLNKIEMVNEPSEKTGKILSKRKSTEISYNKNDLQSLVNNLSPVAKKRGFEVYGTVATTMKKKPNFGSALAKNYSIKTSKGNNTKSLNQLLDSLDNIPKKDFIFMDGIKRGAVSKIVYTTLLNGGNIDELFESEEDKELAIKGFTTYLATEMLGQEVLKVLDSPMGTVDTHEGVVIRDKKIADVPFKLSGAFIRRGMTSDF